MRPQGKLPKQTPAARSARLTAVGGLAGALLAAGTIYSLTPDEPEPQSPPAQPVVAEVLPTPASAATLDAGATRVPSAGRPSVPRRPARLPTIFPELTSVYEWPLEPDAPRDIDEKRFSSALLLLCGDYADKQLTAWFAPWVLRSSRDFHTDPFLLGALAFHMSGCHARSRGDRIGLTGLDPTLYRGDLSDKSFRYRAFEDGAWQERTLEVERFPFETRFLESPESNLYFAAATLRGWQDQARGLRAVFAQPSDYRHYVSHFVWGDLVQSHREEDWILVERRRLLEYYGALPTRPPARFHGFLLGCPLDGCPRVVTSTLGDTRAEGTRVHAGNDFESTRGEPVRAIADGTVLFAGVDLPGRGAASKIPIWAQRGIDPELMGAGGLYVCIDHGASDEGEKLVSCSMHLDNATVVQGRVVQRGEQIGVVGTSGIKESRPHLHFELHTSKGVQRAMDVLTGLALGHPVSHQPAGQPAHNAQPDP